MSCTKSISISFSGITFDDSNVGFGDVNRTFDCRNNATNEPGTCLYSFQTKPSGAHDAYASLFVKLTNSLPVTVIYQIYSDTYKGIIFQGITSNSLDNIGNWLVNGGMATIVLN